MVDCLILEEKLKNTRKEKLKGRFERSFPCIHNVLFPKYRSEVNMVKY